MILKKQLLFFILIIVPGLQLYSQNDPIEKRKQQLLTAKEDTLRVKILYNLCIDYTETGDYKQALNYGMESIKLAEKIHFTGGLAGAYINTGVVFYSQGNYAEALKYDLIGLKYSEQIHDNKALVNSYTNIAMVYATQGDYDKSLANFNQAAEVMKQLDDKGRLGVLYSNIASLYFLQEKYTESFKTYSLALELQKETQNKNGMIITLCDIGEIYVKQNNFHEALKYNFEALDLAKEIKDKKVTSISYINIGEIYLKQKKTDEAIKYFKQALGIAKEIGSLDDTRNIYEKLTNAYKAKNNCTEEISSYRNYILYRDSIFNKENTKKIVSAQMQYDFDKKEAATKSEQEIKNAEAKEEIQKEKTVKISIALGSGLLIVIMLLFINRKKAKHNLQVNQLENKTLRSQLNPHFIFNALASIREYMHNHPELAEDYLGMFGRLMREVLENSEREYVSLEEEFEMLKKYIELEAIRIETGIDYEFIIDKNTDTESIQVPPLLLQPIVENAIWHGIAHSLSKGKISITAGIKNDILKVTIENQSIALGKQNQEKKQESEKKKSFGLQIVKERLALLSKEKRKKGSLILTPTENGMKVTVEIPL